MFRILLLMVALLAGLIAGPYLSGNQGYVQIETTNHIIEMSLTTLVILFVAILAIIYALEWMVSRFLRLSGNTYSWFSRRKRVKAQRQTLEGLMRMNEGDYAKAEKLIGKNAKHSDEPVLNLIKAAEAAQQKGDEFTANRYLIEATELAGSDNLLVELARTRILLQQNKLPAARSSVDSLLEMAGRNKKVLKLAVEIYSRSKAYQALDQLLDAVRDAGLYSNEEFAHLKVSTEAGLLDEKMNEEGVDGLLSWWDGLPRRRHNDIELKTALISRLIDCNDQESAYEFTLDIVKKSGDNTPLSHELCQQITRLQPVDNAKLIKLLEKRCKHSDPAHSCCLHRALGYLYVRNNEFASAADAFKQVIESPDKLTATDLTMATYVFEKAGETALAEQVKQQSLQSAMSINPESTALTESK